MSKVEKAETQTTGKLPPEMALDYIGDMLGELSQMAEAAGLRDMAALLRATKAVSNLEVRTAE